MKLALPMMAPGLATFGAWQATLGWIEPDDYSEVIVAVLVLALLGIGVATGWLIPWAQRTVLYLACGSAVTGISAACWLDWSDDPTGLFAVGWFMLTSTAAIVSYLVIAGTAWYLEPGRTHG